MTNLLSLKDICKYLSIHQFTAWRLTKAGVIPGFKVGGQYRFKQEIIDAWIEERMTKDCGKRK